MKFWALLLLCAPVYAGTWTVHPIIPFGPLAPCPGCSVIPGDLTIGWDTPTVGEDGAVFAVNYYVMVYEDFDTLSVDFIYGIPASANRYDLTGLTSGVLYKVWLEAHGADGQTHAVTPLLSLRAP